MILGWLQSKSLLSNALDVSNYLDSLSNKSIAQGWGRKMLPYFMNCKWNIICFRKTAWFLILGVNKFQNTFIFNLRMLLRFISSVQSLSHVWLLVTPWTEARQASLSINSSRSLLKLMSIKSGMSFNHLLLYRPLLLLPSIFPRVRVFSHESVLHIRWPNY